MKISIKSGCQSTVSGFLVGKHAEKHMKWRAIRSNELKMKSDELEAGRRPGFHADLTDLLLKHTDFNGDCGSWVREVPTYSAHYSHQLFPERDQVDWTWWRLPKISPQNLIRRGFVNV